LSAILYVIVGFFVCFCRLAE